MSNMKTYELYDPDTLTKVQENIKNIQILNDKLLRGEMEARKGYEKEIQDYRKSLADQYHNDLKQLAAQYARWDVELDEQTNIEKAEQEEKFLKEFNDKRKRAYAARIKAEEKDGKKLNKEEIESIKKQINTEYSLKGERAKKFRLEQAKQEEKERRARNRQIQSDLQSQITGRNNSFSDRVDAWRSLTKNEDGSTNNKAALYTIANMMSDLAKTLNNKIDSIGSYKGRIDTRLQGSYNKRAGGVLGIGGSYWDQITKDYMGIAAMSPLIKQETLANNLAEYVNRGISYNVEQRAFLATISEKIATTFNATDGTLLRLIRLQQKDSTAARLGMESALTTFLNSMYETTEYLSDAVASSVRGSLEEMESLMSDTAATEIEYQVQKWMGSLYSVGMSQEGVSSIASAFGKLAAGDIDGITNGGAGNLLVMAANQAGLSISDILANGLNASETNVLMQKMVEYLADIAESSADSRVVQQQLASVYGLKASDLKAVGNLSNKKVLGSVSNNSLSSTGMMAQLYSMAATMGFRTSTGEKLNNLWDNLQYSLAAGIASNPALYAIYKSASLLDATTGGIALPAVSAAGFGVDLETTVANLMRAGALGGGILSNIGNLISGVGAGGNGATMLALMQAKSAFRNGISAVARGGIQAITSAGSGVSESGYVGNSSGSDVEQSTMSSANDKVKQESIKAKESEDTDIQNKVINENLLNLYNLIQEVVDGTQSLHVKLDNQSWTVPGVTGGY